MNRPPRFPWSKQAALNRIFFATLVLFVSVKTALAVEPTNSANEVEIVMDCTKAKYVGPWATGMAASKYRFIGGSMPNCYASFRPDLPISGNYEIYERRSRAAINRAENARYEISFKGGSKTSWVNQQINGQQWNLLGVFPFDAGTNGEVRIDDANGIMGRMLIADRVAFVLPKTNALPLTEVSPKIEIVVEATQAVLTGSWTNENGQILSTPFEDKGTRSAYATFRPVLPTSGRYDVYEWHESGKNRAKDVPLVITLAITNGSWRHGRTLNQQTNGDQWNRLGRFFYFPAGTNVEVRVTDAISTPGARVIVPKFRFVLEEAPEK